MITETGKIIAIEEIEGETRIKVECISKSACSSCSSNSSCGVGVVSKAFSDKSQYFSLPYKEGMQVNHFVELQISDGDLIKSASLIYLLPLFFFICSALIMKSFFSLPEAGVITISAVFTGFGFFITRHIANRLFPIKPNKQLIDTQIIN